LLAPGIALFLYAMTEAGNHGGFDNTHTIATGTAGLALVALFVWHAGRRGKQAGAALAMPLAGWLTDKVGARLVVSTGIAIAALGMLAYTQVGAHTSYLYYLALALLIVGLGIGSLMVPSMAAVFQALSPEETPRGTSALNAIQRIAGAIGTALLAIILQQAIGGRVPGFHGGIQGVGARARQPHAAPLVADAFGTTFWVAVALIAAGLVPALLLPRARHGQQADQAAEASGAEQRRAA
jgi:MFS family permease